MSGSCPSVILIVWLTVLSHVKSKAASPIIIAHRGASGYLPEHTLPAKAFAYGLGADYLEQDVALTKDNVPIVIHDIYLDEVTNVKEVFPSRARPDTRFYAIDFTINEIKQLRATERFNHLTGRPVYPGRFPVNTSTFTISTLAEELEFIIGHNQAHKHKNRPVGAYVEIKQPAFHTSSNRSNFSEIVLDVLEKYNYTRRTDLLFLQCFDIDELRRIRNNLKSDLKLVALLNENSNRTEDGVKEMATFVQGIGSQYSQLFFQINSTIQQSSLYDYARKYNLFMHPYTFRSDQSTSPFPTFDAMLEFFIDKLKIDGLFVDQPDKVVKFLQSRK